MGIEPEISFPNELQEMMDDKIFKRQLILWYYFKKGFNITEISRETDVPYQTVRDCITKWEKQRLYSRLEKGGRPSLVSPEEQNDIIEMQKEDRRRSAKSLY